jgi:integrase
LRIANVRIWTTQNRKGRPKPYQVRWAVDGKPFYASYRTSAHAELFRGNLIAAANRGEHFDTETGLPLSMQPEPEALTWYEFARLYAEMKWPGAAANTRKNTAAALAGVTTALIVESRKSAKAPDAKVIRRALTHWAFRPAERSEAPTADVAAALEWVADHSRPVSDLNDLDVVRHVLRCIGLRLDGRAARPSSSQRIRAVLHNALEYAVEKGALPQNPIDKIGWRAPRLTRQVDPRVVVSPQQARELLTAVTYVGTWEHQRGRLLMPFFATLYFAALRPEEAVELRLQDCDLPAEGAGLLTLNEVSTRAGSAWTDDGRKHEQRGLKHRARGEVRLVPISPELVRILRAYIDEFGTAEGGRLFRSPNGGRLDSTRYLDVWHKARGLAFPPGLAASPLARRPYDLRHAAVSLWLNSGVPAADVAGHSVAVLLDTYYKCIHGQREQMVQRIIDALGRDPGAH